MTVVESAGQGAGRFVRWLKTTAGIVSSIVVLFGFLSASSIFLYRVGSAVMTKLTEIGDATKNTEDLKEQITDLTTEITDLKSELEIGRRTRSLANEDRASLSERIAVLEAASDQRTKPSMRFIRFAPHAIMPARAGEVTEVQWYYVVDYACGRPKLTPQMRDVGRYEHDMRTVGFNGTASEVGKELEIRYRVRAPSDALPGTGKHWVLVEYAAGACPPIRSPEIDFEILPPRANDLGGVATFP